MDIPPSMTTEDTTPETPPTDPDRQECLDLLRQVAQLRQEQDHIDGMLATLRGDDDIL